MRLQQTHLDEWRHLLMELQHEQQQVEEEQQQLEQREVAQQLLNSLSPQKHLVPRADAVPNGWETDSRSPERSPPASAPAVSNSGSFASFGVPPTTSQTVKGRVLLASSPAPATRAATRKGFSAAASRVQTDLEVAVPGMGCDIDPSVVEPKHEETAEEAEIKR